MPAGMRGYWSPAHRTILVLDGLTVVERRCVLAHELAHVQLGHRRREGVDGAELTAIQEDEADQFAARRLIDLTMLASVADVAVATAADLLFVTPKVYRDRLAHLHPSERAYLKRSGSPGIQP